MTDQAKFTPLKPSEISIDKENGLTITRPKFDYSVIFEHDQVETVLNAITEYADASVPDTETSKGRDAVRALAASIARSKTFLDGEAVKVKEAAQEQVNKVNSQRRTIKSTLDAARDKARKPLTEWEDAEKERQQNIQVIIDQIIATGKPQHGEGSKLIQSRIKALDEISISEETLQERAGEARDLYATALETLQTALSTTLKAEETAKENERLRQENEALQAEQRRQKQAAAAKAAEAEAAQKAQRDKEQAEAKAKEQERLQAEAVAKAAAEGAARQKRLAKEQAERISQRDAKRAADEKNRSKKINETAMSIIATAKVSAKAAEAIATAIADGQITHTTMQF